MEAREVNWDRWVAICLADGSLLLSLYHSSYYSPRGRLIIKGFLHWADIKQLRAASHLLVKGGLEELRNSCSRYQEPSRWQPPRGWMLCVFWSCASIPQSLPAVLLSWQFLSQFETAFLEHLCVQHAILLLFWILHSSVLCFEKERFKSPLENTLGSMIYN